MSRLIIIVHEATSVASRNLITAALKNEGVGYWHWFQHAWLVTDSANRKPTYFRALIGRVAPGTKNVVLDADGGNWAAFTTPTEMKWLNETWSRRKG